MTTDPIASDQPARPDPDNDARRVGVVSLGCPKALVDSERILTSLRADGYEITDSYDDADAVIVNTCGFLDSAKAESLEAIGEAIAENGRVIVTGCLGVEAERIRAAHPQVLAITGPHQYEAVVAAVRAAAPMPDRPFINLTPPGGLKLTPRHYAYLKISEGCNNSCSFCIIPDIRGRLVSRPIHAVLREAERLVAAGVKELLVISQDTSAYGVDRGYAAEIHRGRSIPTRFIDLARELGELGVWVRLHYVYPYPHVDEAAPLMADGKIAPYLDIPFQHASPTVLKAMRRPAAQEKTLARIARWREICPEIAIRSTFIAGFPGETDEDVDLLLEWLEEARLDRVGVFKYENVAGARANAHPDQIDEDVKTERWELIMRTAAAISAERLAERVGATTSAIIDSVDPDSGAATGRTIWDAPEIDGTVAIADPPPDVAPGDVLRIEITGADEFDLTGRVL